MIAGQTLTIPRIIHTTWIGNKPAPTHYIETWKKHHPDWEFKLWDNKAVFESGRVWRLQAWIDLFVKHELWAGAADCIRYETLCEFGGFNAGADAICFERIDELFTDANFDAYLSYENEKVRGHLVTPLLACSPNNIVAKAAIEVLALQTPKLGQPWMTTGNLFMERLIELLQYDRLKVWPSHLFIPRHYTGAKYEGNGKVYGEHMWGSLGGYEHNSVKDKYEK